MFRTTTCLLLLAVLPLLFACAGEEASGGGGAVETQAAALDESIEEATDAMALTSLEAPLLILSVSGLEGASASSPREVAAQVAAQLPEALPQPDCVTVTTEGTVNTYTFTACEGPYGQGSLNGSLVVAYELVGATVRVQVDSQELSVQGTALELHAEVTYRPGRQTQTLTATLYATATGRRAQSVTRQGSMALAWQEEEGCLAIDAELSAASERHHSNTTVDGLAWCADLCPEAGGAITYTEEEQGKTVVLAFDGSSQVTWTLSKGEQQTSGQLQLSCAP